MLLCTSSARMNASREQGVDEMFIRRPWSLPCRAASNSFFFFFFGGYHPNRFFSVSDHRCVNIQKISISFIFQPFIHERKRRSQELLEGKQPCVSTLEFQVEDGRDGVVDRPDKEGPNNCGRCRVFLVCQLQSCESPSSVTLRLWTVIFFLIFFFFWPDVKTCGFFLSERKTTIPVRVTKSSYWISRPTAPWLRTRIFFLH